MAAEGVSSGRGPAARLVGVVRRTAFAVRVASSRRDGRATAAVALPAYFALYSAGIGHLGLAGKSVERGDAARSGPLVDGFVVTEPLATATERVAPFQYEPVALLTVGPAEYLFAPVNAALGLALGVLVGMTLAVSVVAWRGPSACRIGAGAGAAAGVPGLLSGFACCGPTILLVAGVQASAGLLAAFRWLLPLSVAGLLVTLLWVGSRVDSDAVS